MLYIIYLFIDNYTSSASFFFLDFTC